MAGYDGAGADPDYGRSCIAENAELILKHARQHTADADVIVVTAGLGGGTGSSVRELIKIISEITIPIVCLVTLPMDSESGIAKVNAVRAINELLESALDGWILIDNAQLALHNQSAAARNYFTLVNQHIIDPLDRLNRLNERSDTHAIRAFDGEDFRKVLLAGGIIHYETVQSKVAHLDTAHIVDLVRQSLSASHLMPAGFDPAHLSHLALIVETPEAVLAETPMAMFNQLNEELKHLTRGAAIDVGIYQLSNPSVPSTLRLIAVSRALPAHIQDVVNRARDEGKILSDKLHESLPVLELGEIESFDLFGRGARRRVAERGRVRNPEMINTLPGAPNPRRPTTATTTPSPSGFPPAQPSHSQPAMPIVGSYHSPTGFPPPARRPISSPPPLPMHGSEEQHTVTPTGKGGEKAKATARSGPAKKGKSKKENETLPSAEFYDDLVERFRKHKNDQIRNDIAQQLEADFRSPHAVVRFYAVDAMAKLDRKRFESVLLAATEDDNTAVRKIAHSALQR
jgi:cell division GTPase FtsZ